MIQGFSKEEKESYINKLSKKEKKKIIEKLEEIKAEEGRGIFMNIFDIIAIFLFIFFLCILMDGIYDYYSSGIIMKKWEPLSKDEKEEFIKKLSKKDKEKLLRRIEILQDREKKKQEKILKKTRKREREKEIEETLLKYSKVDDKNA
ncbi:MAG: hypothetical protein SOW67_03975 [Fusobacterium necrophorum]|nr:hypothetical protein [Fusobacterium necrophorum]